MSPSDSYDRVAAIYDFEYGECDGPELKFWDRMASEAGEPALELAVGTGRVALPLVQKGHTVWGIDASQPMLDRALAKARKLAPAVRSRLHLLRRDVRGFNLGRRFGLIYIPFNSFLLLSKDWEAPACLDRVALHLKPDGRFVIDAFAMSEYDEKPDVEVLTFLDPEPQTGAKITRRRDYSFDRDIGCAHNKLSYVVELDSKKTLAFEFEYMLHLYTAEDLRTILGRHGLEVEAVYGGYDYSAFRQESENLILVCKLR